MIKKDYKSYVEEGMYLVWMKDVRLSDNRF